MEKRAELMKDPAYDPTDNCAPYGDSSYTRIEFTFVDKTFASTIAATYSKGKSSNFVYEAPIDAQGLKCIHLCATIANPLSCTYCNHDALKKYTFHRIYDDHVETNMASSCLCWVVDNTQVYYLDRDWAQEFEVAGLCTPTFTHCGRAWDCFGLFGASVIGTGATNGVCCPGARRIAVPLCGMADGPLFFGFCPIGNKQWVAFCAVDKEKKMEFVDKLNFQRSAIVSQFKVEPGAAGLPKPAAASEQARE